MAMLAKLFIFTDSPGNCVSLSTTIILRILISSPLFLSIMEIVQVVFMICAVAAINPGQRCVGLCSIFLVFQFALGILFCVMPFFRDLVYALLDNLSTQLWYSSRTKVLFHNLLSLVFFIYFNHSDYPNI